MTGQQIAQKLKPAGTGVVPSQCGDFYDPVADVIFLGEGTWFGEDSEALARAAHECGHAMQRWAQTPTWRVWRWLPITGPLWWACLAGSAFAWMLGNRGTACALACAAVLLGASRWVVVLLLEREASALALTLIEGMPGTGIDVMKARNELRRALRTYVVR